MSSLNLARRFVRSISAISRLHQGFRSQHPPNPFRGIFVGSVPNRTLFSYAYSPLSLQTTVGGTLFLTTFPRTYERRPLCFPTLQRTSDVWGKIGSLGDPGGGQKLRFSQWFRPPTAVSPVASGVSPCGARLGKPDDLREGGPGVVVVAHEVRVIPATQ